MENKTETNVTKNRDCTINITNINGQDDKLAKYNIVEEKIENVQRLEKEFSSRERLASNVFNMQLPRELQNDFEVLPEKIGNDMVFVTKPKTQDAYQRFPQSIKFKVNPNNIKDIQNFKSKKLEEIVREMYQKQISIDLGNVEEIKEYLGDFENPLSLFNKFGSSGTVYMTPEPFPDARPYDIEIFNDEFDVKFRNTMLRLKEINDGTFVLSNSEDILDHYDITMNLTFLSSNSANFNLNIKIRNDYMYDFETVREIIKFKELIDDKKSRFILKDNLTGNVLFNTDKFGYREIKKSEYRDIQKYIEVLDKIIYIEKNKNLKFRYDSEEVSVSTEYIDLVYRAIRNENCSINKKTGWVLGFDLETADKEIKKIESNDKVSFDLEKLNLLGCVVPINLYRFSIIDYKVCSKEKSSDTMRIKLSCLKVSIKLR